MVSPCGDEGEFHYNGSAIKKQEGSPPDLQIANSTTSRHDEGKNQQGGRTQPATTGHTGSLLDGDVQRQNLRR